MLKSMTGYGSGEWTQDGRRAVVEMKAVNHKFVEYAFRVPKRCAFLEERLRTAMQGRVFRGKVELSVSLEFPEEESVQVFVHHGVAAQYAKALRELAREHGASPYFSAGELARCPEVLQVVQAPLEEQAVWQAVQPALELALERFLSMRAQEGRRMQEDIQHRAETVLQLVEQVEERSPQAVKEYEERLLARLQEILPDMQVDPQRVLMEAAVFADKTAVAEETVRLRSHVDQLLGILQEEGPVGRKLDFLVQEMNREANTIGSKAQDTQTAYLVVNLKAEIEKIREQVQNIE